jgi:agmatine/peptidylarginine deiminase
MMIRTAILALALSASLASAQEVADLSGLWTVQASTKHRPGSALFSEREVVAGTHRYKVRLITHGTDGVTRRDLRAAWDGKVLAIGKGTVSFSGLVDVIAGTAASTASSGVATYELGAAEGFALEQLTLTGGEVAGARLPRELRRAQAPDVRAPAEWETAEEILWGYRDEFAVARIYAGAIKATIAEGVSHWLYVTSKAAQAELEYELAEAEVPMDRARFSKKKFQTVWMRDFGPITLEGLADGQRLVGDMGYYEDRPRDDYVPAQYAEARGWKRRDVESLLLEGGNFMSDGKGRLFTTSRALQMNPSQAHVEDRLRDLGAREVVFVERMPEPEGTGHIDMFAKLVDEDTVLVGRCTDQPHFAAVLDRNAERFRELGYEVIRLTMASGPKLMTYTNSLFVGGTVLVPVYANAARDRAALKVYTDLGWNAVGIDARTVIKANGAIHCISMQIPR